MGYASLLNVLAVLAAGVLLVALCRRAGLSPVLAYLATGVLAGPFGLGWLADEVMVHQLANLGVILLMFLIGLEFSLSSLLAAKRLVLGLGGAQVLVAALLLGLGCLWLGLTIIESFVLGAALAFASRSLVLKHLGEQMELPAPHGRVAESILLFQTMAVVPLLVALSVLAVEPARVVTAMAPPLVNAVLVFTGLVLLGRRVLPPLLHRVSATHSLELFMLMILLMAVGAAGLSGWAGLPSSLCAFMAGMLLGETPFRHPIEMNIRPFRGLILGLFFATVGMQLDPGTFVQAPAAVAMVFTALVLLKPLVLAPLVRLFDQTWTSAWRGALSLAHGGEFGLLMVSSAWASGLIVKTLAQPVLGGLVLSMAAAPLLLRFNGRITGYLTPGANRQEEPGIEARIARTSHEFDQHVIVCGYGRLGQNLVRILAQEGVDALALDLDPDRVRQASAAGEPVMLGNAAQPGVLRAAGLERARALAITVDDAALAERILKHVQGLGAALPVLVRNTRGRDEQTLIEAGARVFPESMETSLAFTGQLLTLLGFPPSQVEERLNAVRAQDYSPLRVFFHDTVEEGVDDRSLDFPEQVRSVIVGETHHAAGRTPEELRLQECGVELMDVRRGATRVPGSLLDTRLRGGDVLLIEGTRAGLEKAIACLTEGI